MIMKRVVRPCVFESNSSTSHSCIIMTDEMYKKWQSENLYYYKNEYMYWDKLPKDKRPNQSYLYTQDEVLAFYKEIGYPFDLENAAEEYGAEKITTKTEEILKDQYIIGMDDFINWSRWINIELEGCDNSFETPNGEQIRVLCKYGWDG